MLIPTILIGVVVVLTIVGALVRHRDTFHPALFIGPMLAFHYCYSPLVLQDSGGFVGYLWSHHVERAQWVHLAGVGVLCLGLLWGSRRRPLHSLHAGDPPEQIDRVKLLRGSLVLGIAGLASFAYGINYVGGFTQAYGRAYGGGSAESGWIRDTVLLCLPALLLLTIANRGKRLQWKQVALALLLASPFLIHGLLGARRGPTFMGLAGPAMLFYMARGKRPSLPTLFLGGAVLGTLLLALVANRQFVYLGTNLELDQVSTKYVRAGSGHDFIYGAGLVVVSDELQSFSWGTTYLVTLFVRPIPRAIWPTKYIDAAEFFDRPGLEENLGVDIRSFNSVLGWTAALGAAPGIVGDMWREFSWAMLLPLWGIGWFYGRTWYKAVTQRAGWVPTYCFAASLSLYLVMQTLEAMLYRFLFGLVPMLLALRYARIDGRRSALTADTDTPTVPQSLTR